MDRSIILIIFLDLLEESIFEDSSQLPPDNSFRWDSARRLQRGISGDPAVILAHFCFVLMLLDSSIIPCSVMHRTRSSMTEFRAQFRQFRVPPSPPLPAPSCPTGTLFMNAIISCRFAYFRRPKWRPFRNNSRRK